MDRRPAPLLLLALVAASACGSSVSTSRSARPSRSPRPSPSVRPSRPPAGGNVQVSPGSGTPRTPFTVSFRVPPGAGAGRIRGLWVSASGPAGRDCAASAVATVANPVPGTGASAVLRPGGGGSWCPGTYSGRVVMTAAPACRPGEVCPMILVALPIGQFRFRVSH